MKKLFGILLFTVGFLSATYVLAQVYDGMHDPVVEPMDRVAQQHKAVYANVGVAGGDEDAIPQDKRYTDMMEPMDNVIDQHFNVVTNHQTAMEDPTFVEEKALLP